MASMAFATEQGGECRLPHGDRKPFGERRLWARERSHQHAQPEPHRFAVREQLVGRKHQIDGDRQPLAHAARAEAPTPRWADVAPVANLTPALCAHALLTASTAAQKARRKTEVTMGGV